MGEPTIENDTTLYCWTCGNVDTGKTSDWDYDAYADAMMPYCSKCGHRTYLLKESEKNGKAD